MRDKTSHESEIDRLLAVARRDGLTVDQVVERERQASNTRDGKSRSSPA